MHQEAIASPIRQFVSDGHDGYTSKIDYLFGNCPIPWDYFSPEFRAENLLPGDVVPWEFETEALYSQALFPPQYEPHGYVLSSLKRKDSQIEIAVYAALLSKEEKTAVALFTYPFRS